MDDDPARAREVVVREVSETYRQDFAPLANRYLLHGTPQGCLRRLREYRDAGADILVLKLAASRGDRDVMVRRVAEEIVAPLREEETADGS